MNKKQREARRQAKLKMINSMQRSKAMRQRYRREKQIHEYRFETVCPKKMAEYVKLLKQEASESN